MKRMVCFLTALFLVFSACYSAGSASGMTEYETDVLRMHEEGVINKKRSGFNSQETITVGEFLSCLEKILTEEKLIAGTDSFFHAGAIRFGFEHDILDSRSYPDIRRVAYGTYRQIDSKLMEQSMEVYGAPLRKGQAAQILLCAVKEPAGSIPEKDAEKIRDISEASEAERNFLCTAWNKGIFETDEKGNIYPNRPVTVGEACHYFNLTFFEPEKRSAQQKNPGNISVKQACRLNENAVLLLDENGTLWGWGINGENELGLGYRSGFELYPKQIAQNVVKCWSGREAYFYLTQNNELWYFTSYQDILAEKQGQQLSVKPYLLREHVLDFCNTGYDSFVIDTDNVLYRLKSKMFGGDPLTMGATFAAFDAVQVKTDGGLCVFVLKKDGSLSYSDITKNYYENLDEEVAALYGAGQGDIPQDMWKKYPSVLYYIKKNGEKYALLSHIGEDEIQVEKRRIETSERECAFVSAQTGYSVNYHTRLYVEENGDLWAEFLSSGKKQKLMTSVKQVEGGLNFGLAVTDDGTAYQIVINGENIRLFSF